MARKTSVGMVGLGQFGIHFVELFKDHPKVGRLALCDLDPRKLKSAAKKFGVSETYSSLDEICKSDLDALVIITQPWLHAPQAIQAMKSGKHVYSAVPVISTESGSGEEILEWCDKLIDTCKKTGMHYMMGETTYFRPETVFARKKYEAGDLGKVVLIESDYMHDTWNGHPSLIDVQMARTGKSKKEVYKIGGSAPMHYPTHSTSAPISITGAHMVSVSALGYVYPKDDYFRKDSTSGNIFCNEAAQYQMSNGTIARCCELRRIGHGGREGLIRILGTKASLDCHLSPEEDANAQIWDTGKGRRPANVLQARDKLPAPLARNLGFHGGSHAYLVHDFVDAIVNNRTPKINAWEAVRYMAAGVMAHESAKKDGALMKVPDWGDAPK